MQLIVTFSWHFVSNFLVAALSGVTWNSAKSVLLQVVTVTAGHNLSLLAGVPGLPSLEDPQ